MSDKIEIMSPVGSYESLWAAIQGGANAVYFGVGKLNMRSRSAANFTVEDLGRICAIAHEAGVRTYLSAHLPYGEHYHLQQRDCGDARPCGCS